MTQRRLALLGAGVMGETLLAGLLRAGWSGSDVVVTDRRPERCDELVERYGVTATGNVEAVQGAETVVVVVKPQDLDELLAEIGPELADGVLLVSLCAGVTTASIESRVGPGVAVVRVMPNTPAQVSQGMAAISAGAHAGPDDLVRVETMLAATGRVLSVPEKYQDAVTAISGSGPAYLFYVVESMIEAGVQLGLPRDISTELVVQTMLGSATLLSQTGGHPTELREMVTSPGGTTAAAVRTLEQHGVRAAFMAAIESARDRSRLLSGS
ncbi:pyrroline-5-carboxylate reductase [Auraticoccus monumenti]|uniref:Pyrroline-5-carboxylate reductase n=1 Tax=Auraticoccus monumenti TaxID=675864 RepID=A0A1G6RMZ9_9ACTN|nr:pyrroline-5-carboxylate reductase [Auraticoccus monumenti]SDD06050.1 pyrroline-5-carboxylate reductase [Auraticoccus monumenti]